MLRSHRRVRSIPWARSMTGLLVLSICVLVPGSPLAQCTDCDGDGVARPADCNDLNASVFPGAAETCNSIDDDCDGLIDEEPGCPIACGAISDLSPDRQVSSDAATSWQPSLASTGDGYAVAWSDFRDGSTFQVLVDFADDLGRPAGSPVQVTTLGTSAVQPSLAWTGSGFGLAYARGGDLLFQRLASDGTPLGLPVTVATGSGQLHSNPHLIWTGQAFALVAERLETGAHTVVFAALDPEGSIAIPPVVLDSGADPLRRPRIASDGVGYGVVWETEDAGNGALSATFVALDAAGSVTSGPLPVSGDPADSRDPDIAWNGALFAVAWRDQRDGNAEIYFNRLDAAGTAQGSDVRVTTSAGVSNEPRLTWTGARHALVWRDRRDGNGEIYFTMLDGAGAEDGDDRRLTVDGGDSYGPIPVFTGSTVGVAWVDDRTGVDEVRLLQVGCGCTDGDGDGISDCHDCDDGEPDVYPGAPQICDGLNNDCDHPDWPSQLDDDIDADGDMVAVCQGDCDDADATVYPDAPEICDGLNNDCNDPSWPALPASELDGDGDTFAQCADCDDTAPAVYPGAPQVCDGLNNDCDDPAWPALTGTNESDPDGDGFSECAGDCSPQEGAIYPGAPQTCDGLNNDCNDPVWPGLAGTGEIDDDLDGYSACGGDCAPFNPAVYPGAPQVCDGLNNDCNDPSWPARPPGEEDLDLDSFPACADCDDGDPSIYPGAPEVCDGSNNNCDDPAWPDLAGTGEIDDDGDGVTACQGDCEPYDLTVYPGAPEICDARDNDCDGLLDEDLEDCLALCQPPVQSPPTSWIATSDSHLQSPWLVRSSTGYGFAWMEELSGPDRLWFMPLDTSGAPAGAPQEIASTVHDSYSGSSGRAFTGGLAYTGDGYGVAWVDGRHGAGALYFARLDLSGQVLQETRVSEPEAALIPAGSVTTMVELAWGGGQFALAWLDERAQLGNSRLYARLLSGSGLPATGEVEIPTPAEPNGIGMVWVQDAYSIVWEWGFIDGIGYARLDATTGQPVSPPDFISIPGAETVNLRQLHMVEGGLTVFAFVRRGATSTSSEMLRLEVDGSLASTHPFPVTPLGIGERNALWTGDYWLLLARPGRLRSVVAVDRDGSLLWSRPWSAASGDMALGRHGPSDFMVIFPARNSGSGFTYDLARLIAPCNCPNVDGDPASTCDLDCDDTDPAIYPGAPESCDQVATDCNAPGWPALAPLETDLDGDGAIECADTCPGTPNPAQDPAEPCPGCLAFSGGTVLRGDQDGDGLPDACDPDDGFQWIGFDTTGEVLWHLEPAWERFNLYRGSLDVLKANYVYTQQPGSNSLASQSCDLTVDSTTDSPLLESGEVAFYLLTGEGPDPESGLGDALWPPCECYSCIVGYGQPLCYDPPVWLATPEARENANPCP